MNGQSEQGNNGSSTTRPTGPRVPSPLDRLRAQAMVDHAHDERRRLQKEKEQFRKWKKELCRIIQTESEMARNPDGSYSFVLPPKITRLVWEVMLREHVKMRGCSREEAANVVRRGFLEAADKLDKVVVGNQDAIAKAEQQLGRPVQAGDVIETPLGRARIAERPVQTVCEQPVTLRAPAVPEPEAPRDDAAEAEAAAALAKMREEMVRGKSE